MNSFKFSLIYLCFFCLQISPSWTTDSEAVGGKVGKEDFYSFTALDTEENSVSLEQYRGMVLLVVNVASECGFTDGHYRALVKLQQDLAHNSPFTVLAFPCNQFGAQEPGSNPDILNFARRMYGVNFPIFSKINVLGAEVPRFWSYLVDQAGISPTWNFWKYLIDQDGRVVNAWGPRISVEAITPDILRVLNKQNDSGARSHVDDEL